MASKKYTLIAGLMLAAATSGFSQLGGVVDYKDSTKVPASRLAQQNEWRGNSLTQSFPARPRDKWQVGIYGGYFSVDGDVPPSSLVPGFNVGLQARKALTYVFSVRGSVGYGQTKGLDYRQQTNFNNLPQPVRKLYVQSESKFYVSNFKTTAFTPSIDVLASLNNIAFHRKSNWFNVYVLAGYTGVFYQTKIDALKGNTPYTFQNIDFGTKGYREIQKELKNVFDGTYETYANYTKRRSAGTDGGNGPTKIEKYHLRNGLDLGGGLEFKIASNASIGLEAKYIFTGDDNIDGVTYLYSGGPTPKNDGLFFGNLSVNFNIGKSATHVAPLWWLNPLGYVYSELSNPTIAKFPKPVLDDTDHDGVTDQFDIEPNTPAGAPVDTKGKARDTDGDGVPDYLDKELITPTYCQPVDADGVGKCPVPEPKVIDKPNPCNIGSLPSVQFKSGLKIDADATAILSAAAGQIKANPACKISVVGHGGASKREQQLSWDRVETVISYLVEKQGISRDRFIFKYGDPGDQNTVDLQEAAPGDENAPNTVPAPHPQYHKNK
jgi:OOP family OmpA-OmpF porin